MIHYYGHEWPHNERDNLCNFQDPDYDPWPTMHTVRPMFEFIRDHHSEADADLCHMCQTLPVPMFSQLSQDPGESARSHP